MSRQRDHGVPVGREHPCAAPTDADMVLAERRERRVRVNWARRERYETATLVLGTLGGAFSGAGVAAMEGGVVIMGAGFLIIAAAIRSGAPGPDDPA